MNWLDKAILSVMPEWGLNRVRNKALAEQIVNYDASQNGRTRNMRVEHRSGDSAVGSAGRSLRGQARYLDENHDLVIGLLDNLEQKVVGPNGIGVEPLPLTVGGEVHEEFAKDLSVFFEELSVAPETTGELSRAEMERIVCRSWLRDGEVFGKYIEGNVPFYKHNTDILFSVELLEADFLPFDLNDENGRITQGVERNAWGQPVGYHFYKMHPGDSNSLYTTETRRVKSEQVLHLKHTKRLRQARGVSILHGVLTRLEDLKDYEESERVAARISAVLAAYVKKPNPEGHQFGDSPEGRLFNFAPGMVFDNLVPGEEIGTIESNRPSALLQPFRDAMLRAVSKGTRSTFSSVSGHFDGSYSAQRQEMVEGYAGYGVLQNSFIENWCRPFYRRAVQMGITSGRLKVPADIDERTIFQAIYLPPVMPWIDPDKESKAHERNVKAGFSTEAEVIRAKGGNPVEVKRQRAREIKENQEKNLVFSSDARHENQGESNESENMVSDQSTEQ